MAKKKLTKKSLDEETEKLKSEDWSDATVRVTSGPGRPKKSLNAIKTNLDISPELLAELDEIAEFMNISRQALIKSYIMFGVNEHRKTPRKKA